MTLTSVLPLLNITAIPINVTAGIPTLVTFNVTSNGTAVSGATVNLNGAGLPRTTGTTNATGIAIINVAATRAGTITATASKTGYSSGTTTLTASLPLLNITASPTNVTAGTPSPVTFNVTGNGTAINGATVTLRGAGIPTTTGTTNAAGIVVLTVSATRAGNVTATATMTGYTSGTTNITVAPMPVLNISASPVNVTVGTPISVTFNVISNGTAVSGAIVTLTGAGLPATSGTTNIAGIAILSVNPTRAGTITATASKTGYTSGTATITASLPLLNISASLTNVTVGTPFPVTFNVTSNGTAVNGASVTLTGAGLPRTTGTTNTSGIAVISVNARSAGIITATASRNGYTSGTTTINATDQNAVAVVPISTIANSTVVINATNTTNVMLGLNATVSANVSVNITTSTNASVLNINPATPDYGIGSGRRQIGTYISINVTGLNASNASSWNSVNLTFYYNTSLPAFQVNSLRIYWYNPNTGLWMALGPGIRPYPDYTSLGGPKVLYSVLNTTGGYIQVNLNHLSDFVLAADELEPVPPAPPSSGSSGSSSGGGGGGGSGENVSNIQVIEKYDMQISKDVLTSYRYTQSQNPIMFVNITGNTSLGVITGSVEVLKDTSTLVNVAPDGIVYKNANIWIGTVGYATPKNIKEALIKFKVDNAWMSTNDVSGSDVKTLRWDGSQWTQLETAQTAKDDKYTYFEAKTFSFSPFAISGLKGGVVVPTETPGVTETQVKATGTPVPTATKRVPGFEFVLTVALLSVAFLLGRKRR